VAKPEWFRRRGWFALILGTIIAAAVPAGIAGAEVWTDQSDYAPGSVVTIHGGNDSAGAPGYVPGQMVDVAVSGPNGWTSSCSATVGDDESDSWSCQVTLDSDPAVAVGDYSYTATSTDADGNPISESGTFTDVSNVFSANISGDNSAFAGAANAKTYTANPQFTGNCGTSPTVANIGYVWSVTAGTASFSSTTVQNPSVTFSSLGTVTLRVDATITSGGSCTNSTAFVTKNVSVTSTTLTQTLTPSSITYGESTDISGSLVELDGSGSPDATGLAGKPIAVTSNTGAGCTGTATLMASATTLGGGSTPPKGNWPDVSPFAIAYTPSAAGTEYIKADYDGTGNNAPSSDCDTLTIGKADTTTEATPSASSITYGESLTVDYEVYSDHGISGNTATGTASVVKDSGPSGGNLNCTATSTSVSQAQSDADGSGGAKDGFDVTSDSNHQFSCLPDKAGSYTFHVHFADTDGNYNGSDDSPGSSVLVPTQVQVCKAAPAIAADWLHAHGIKAGTKTDVNIVSLIVGERADAKRARFPTYSYTHTSLNSLVGPGALLGPCDTGYVGSVVARTDYWSQHKLPK